MQVLRLCADPVHPEMNTVPASLSQPLSNSQSLRDTKLVGGVKFTDYRMEELNEPPPRLPGVRTLLPLSGGAALLTGGSDCRIRMWDRLRYCAHSIKLNLVGVLIYKVLIKLVVSLFLPWIFSQIVLIVLFVHIDGLKMPT